MPGMPRRLLVVGGDHMERTSANHVRRPGRFDVLQCPEFMTELPARPDALIGACLKVSLQQKALAFMLERLGGAVEFASVLEADQTTLPTGNRPSCNTRAVRSLPRGNSASNSSGPLD